MPNFNRGNTPLGLIIVASLGVLVFLFVTSTFPFKDQLFNTLYPKKTSRATILIPFYGIGSAVIWFGESDQDKILDLAKAAGVGAMRVDAIWNRIETAKGTYDSIFLGRLDYAVNGMVSRGIRPLLIVGGTPSWANGTSDDKVPPKNDQDYADFLGFLMKRYGSKVNDYEIWNEPDGYWSWTNPDPVRYTALLKTAYTFAKTINPNVNILNGSISNVWENNQNFLKGMYAAGAKAYFDTYNQHMYADPPGHGNNTPEWIIDQYSSNIVPILEANGDGSKPIWITEHGYNTSTTGVSEQIQADYLIRAYNKAKTLPNVQSFYYFTLINSGAGGGVDTSDPEQNYGIITAPADGYRLKHAYYAYRALVSPSPSPALSPSPAASALSDTTPPSVSITSPQNGAAVPKKGNLTIQATASDNVAVSKVEFRVNSSLKCTKTSQPYYCVWRSSNKTGITNLEAKAFDAAGNTAASAVSIFIR